MALARSHWQLEVYKKAFDAAGKVFHLSRGFPKEETYSLTDQIRRSSRSVCANLAKAWRKRSYAAAFSAKLCDSEGEAAETQVWIEFAVKSSYLDRGEAKELFNAYEEVIRMIVAMRLHPENWTFTPPISKRKGVVS